jgi:predicted ATPase
MLDRVLITGAHGTGKTTLVDALFARLQDVEGRKWTLVEEVARQPMEKEGWCDTDVVRVRLCHSPFHGGASLTASTSAHLFDTLSSA